ncbi:MAG: hypothetical protein WC107_00630 [Patescibacteria group bacterium]
MANEQKNLENLVKKMARRSPNTIPVGRDLTDIFGRQLKIGASGHQIIYQRALKFLARLHKDEALENMLRGQVMWYDIRSSVWRENPELTVLFALAYASVLIERSGQETGHIINIAVDCYEKHYDSMSIFADTLIQTGIVRDGGIIYWGVQNGGAIRNLSEFMYASTGHGGNWIYGTMSHKADDYLGAKFGMLGKVFCGPDLMQDFYGKFIKGEYPDLIGVNNPKDFAVTVGDLTANNIDICEDLVRARTGTAVPKNELLKGLEIGFNMSGSPVGKNLVEILRAFGAEVEVQNEKLNSNFQLENIIDPNEHESAPMKALKEKAEKDGRIYLALDPDGDRGSIIALNATGKAISLTGTELLMLALENLATYNPDGLEHAIIYDMRTGISANLLTEALKSRNYKVSTIASEPGYPFFMELMSKHKDAVIAVENTNHAFLTPMTNPIWGAPKFYPLVQGGDDAAIFLTYILGLSAQIWHKSPMQQLEYLQKEYDVPQTIIREFKPGLDKKDGLLKYDIANKMCKIAKDNINQTPLLKIDTMNSGIRVTDNAKEAMVLVRYSNTGPTFTASSEALTKNSSDMIFSLGGAIMQKAVNNVIKEKGAFDFSWNDFAPFGNLSEAEADKIISDYNKS